MSTALAIIVIVALAILLELCLHDWRQNIKLMDEAIEHNATAAWRLVLPDEPKNGGKTILFRHGSASANPIVPAYREPILDNDTNEIMIGDGVTSVTDLPRLKMPMKS